MARTSQPQPYADWSTDPVEGTHLYMDDRQKFQGAQELKPFWLVTYDPSGHEAVFDNSNISSPEASYQQLSLNPNFNNHEDFLDLQRIGTPSYYFDDTASETATLGNEPSGTGANKRIRRREQNRASQRAYRDRQRGKISELQAKVIALKAQNEKLQARNDMLEAAFQRDRDMMSSSCRPNR